MNNFNIQYFATNYTYMKPLICFIFCSILCTSVFAQGIQKGDKFFGLQTNLAYTDLYSTYLDLSLTKNVKRAGFHMAPTMQWAIEKNFVFGTALHVGYNSEKTNYNFTYSLKESEVFDLGLNAFSRYYIDILRNKKLKFFGLAGVHLSYASWSNTYTTPANNNSESELVARGSLGFGLAYAGSKGMIDMNISNAGLFLGFHKKLKGKSGK